MIKLLILLILLLLTHISAGNADTLIPGPESDIQTDRPDSIVKSIDVQGCRRLSAGAARNVMLTKAGSRLDTLLLNEDRARLMRTGYYYAVKITHLYRDGGFHINVMVKESGKRTLWPEFNYKTKMYGEPIKHFNFKLTYTIHDIFRLHHNFSTVASVSLEPPSKNRPNFHRKYLGINWEVPYLLKSKYSAGLSSEYYSYPYMDTSLHDRGLFSHIKISRRLSKRISITGITGYNFSNIYNADLNSIYESEKPLQDRFSINRVYLDWNSKDRSLDPNSGAYSRLFMSYYIGASDKIDSVGLSAKTLYDYTDIGFLAQKYFPLGSRQTFAAQLNVLKRNKDIAGKDRLDFKYIFLDGFQGCRGYSGYSVAGNNSAYATLEYRLSIYRAPSIDYSQILPGKVKNMKMLENSVKDISDVFWVLKGFWFVDCATLWNGYLPGLGSHGDPVFYSTGPGFSLIYPSLNTGLTAGAAVNRYREREFFLITVLTF
ncbi:MAG: POTRA domain-containing protein [bacterium]